MAQDERTAVGGPGLTVAVVLSLAMVMAGLAVPSTIGKFEGLFRSLGAELPWLTSTVLSYRIPLFGWLSLCLIGQVVLLIGLASKKTLHARRLFYRVVVANLAVYAVLVFAMYAPIFKLGAPV